MAEWGNRPAIWPPPPTEEQLTVPGLSKDGQHVEGWCRRPADGVWRPADLFWLPPNAVKATDIDGIGHIVDVRDGIGMHAWVTAQLNRREKYLDLIRAKVRAGAVCLTAQLAKMLGLDEDGAELVPRTGPRSYGTVAAAKSLYDEGRRLSRQTGYPIDADTGLPDISLARFHD